MLWTVSTHESRPHSLVSLFHSSHYFLSLLSLLCGFIMAEGTKNQQHANFTDISQDRELLRYEEECGADQIFGMLIAHLYDEYPNFLSQPPPICDLQAFYKFIIEYLQTGRKIQESKKRFDTDADFKRRAYDCVVKLQNNRGLQFLDPDLLREEDGRLVFFPSGCDVPLTVVKSDGVKNYKKREDMRSIIRTTGVSSESLNEFIAVLPSVPLLHPAELKLAKQILKLSDCVLQVLDSLMLHQKNVILIIIIYYIKLELNKLQMRELDSEIVEMYQEVGTLLAKYRSGKIPKAFKIIPKMVNWEQIL
uniref:tRNA-synt_1d domain-containing protein n=1 Tax=Heterorhabditis bacteriophora TaxID=37862 RepID=A0A1I7WJF3_HETBA